MQNLADNITTITSWNKEGENLDFLILYTNPLGAVEHKFLYKSGDKNLKYSLKIFLENLSQNDRINCFVIQLGGTKYLYDTLETFSEHDRTDEKSFLMHCLYDVEHAYTQHSFELFQLCSIKKEKFSSLKSYENIDLNELINSLVEKIANFSISTDNIKNAFSVVEEIESIDKTFIVDYLNADDKEDFFMDILMDGNEEKISLVEKLVVDSDCIAAVVKLNSCRKLFELIANTKSITEFIPAANSLLIEIEPHNLKTFEEKYISASTSATPHLSAGELIEYTNKLNQLTEKNIVLEELTVDSIKKAYAN